MSALVQFHLFQTQCYTFLYWCSSKKKRSGLCWLELTLLYIWCEETLTCKPNIESLLIKFNLEGQTTADKNERGIERHFTNFIPSSISFPLITWTCKNPHLWRLISRGWVTSQWSDNGPRREIMWASEERNVSLVRYLYNRVTKLHSTIPSEGRNV